ncbi:hypothetical protein QN344_01045, partial [Mucilaginibacter sp. 5B2]|nr:hypothetical protein [Mucilaginibacter sp. 5B2]
LSLHCAERGFWKVYRPQPHMTFFPLSSNPTKNHPHLFYLHKRQKINHLQMCVIYPGQLTYIGIALETVYLNI